MRRFYRELKRIEEEKVQLLEKIPRLLEKRFGKATVILIGSRARGTHNPGSDIDLVVITPAFGGKVLEERISLFKKTLETRLFIDLHPYTPEEALERASEDPFILDAVVEGRTLLDTLNIIPKLTEKVARTKLRKTKVGWLRKINALKTSLNEMSV